MTEPGRPGTKGKTDGTPGDSAAAPPARLKGSQAGDSHWAVLNRRMDRLLERMPGRTVRQPEPLPPSPAEPEEEPTPRRPSVDLACPRCGGKVHPSASHGLFEFLLRLFGSGPLRCHSCYYRYGEFLGMRLILKN